MPRIWLGLLARSGKREGERDILPTNTNPTTQRERLTSVLLIRTVWVKPPLWLEFIWVVEVLGRTAGGPRVC